jgi:signal transduction histidine kinase
MLAGAPRSGTATAVASAVLGAVKEETFQEMLEIAPGQIHINFLRAINDRVRSVNVQFMRDTIFSERMRVAGALANAIIQDLKNPVCIARCCSDLIASDSTDPQLRELSNMLADAVNGILGTTLDLLDFSRGAVSVNKRAVSIWRLLDELNRRALHLLPSKKIEFVKHIRHQGNVDIDLNRMARALAAIIENSIDAMSSGGTLTFTIDQIQDQSVIRISDTGTGIPHEVLAKIFEPFDTRETPHHAGVGLAIVKAIVEAHEGKISITTVPGRGTTVDIRLPKPADASA